MMRVLKLTSLLLICLLSFNVISAQTDAPYREPFRPQYHYTPPCGWMNDPNGLVYYEDEYHLFYQFNPADIVWGPMHWGHAVSRDLVHWETLPIALYPDEIGPIWSGSVVVDAQNTSGLVPGGGLVAVYSYENQSQGVAYSTDAGRSWVKYAGNPVIRALADDFRDPKVFWYEPSEQWIMVIAAGHEVQVFASPDLLEWEMTSRFTGGHVVGVWEVPDLFPLEIEGETKWVLLVSVGAMAPAGGGGVQYFIGDFDGQSFTPDDPSTILWLDYGPDNYAGTIWNNAPDDQRIYIGWMSNWLYAAATPTSIWRGTSTLPRELRLVRTPEGIRLAQQPFRSLEALRQPVGTWADLELSGEINLEEVAGRRLEIIAELEAETAERFGIIVHNGEGEPTRVLYNTAQAQLLVGRSDVIPGGYISGFTRFYGAPLELENDRLRLHVYVDEASVEVFAEDGLIAMTSLTFADPLNNGVSLFAENGTARLAHLEIYSLASIWTQDSGATPEADAPDVCT